MRKFCSTQWRLGFAQLLTQGRVVGDAHKIAMKKAGRPFFVGNGVHGVARRWVVV